MSSMIAVAAVIVVTLSMTALAVVGFTQYENPWAMIQSFFGENGRPQGDGYIEHHQEGDYSYIIQLPGWERVPVDETLADELIANYIGAETATITWENYTVAVEANLYDPATESGILYYTVENPDSASGYIDNTMYALIRGGGGSAGSGAYRTTYVFNRIVDISNLVEIVLDDVVIKVN